MCGGNSRTMGCRENMLYQKVINCYLYGLSFLNFVPRDQEKPETFTFSHTNNLLSIYI